MQKELFHNEALQAIDMLLCPAVEGAASPSPPSSPAVGRCYLIGSNATGAWEGQDGSLACFTDGGWRYVAMIDGMVLLDRSSGQYHTCHGGAWEAGIVRAQEVRVEGVTVVRNRQPAVVDPSGGGVVDGECRTAVTQLLAAMRTHGLIA